LLNEDVSLISFVDHLLGLFDDGDVNWVAASVVGEIGSQDGILTKRNHAIIKEGLVSITFKLILTILLQIFHAQKYANIVLPRLIEGANPTRRTYCKAKLVFEG